MTWKSTKTKRPDKFKERHDEVRVKPQGATSYVAIAAPVLVALLGFVAFYPALNAEFVNYDDDRLLVNNTSYRGFGSKQLGWMFSTTTMGGHYQPLTWLSSALDYKISGIDPSSYHRNNLILHGLNGMLLYFIALRLLAAGLKLKPNDHPVRLRLAAAVTALLFSVHPLRVESVAWASERRDVLSVFFLLLALLAYLRTFPCNQTKMTSRRWFIGSWVLLALSLLCKSWGMSFVVVVVILDLYPLRRLPAIPSLWWDQPHRSIWLQKLPYLILGFVAALTAGLAQRSAFDTMKSLGEWGIVERLVQSCYGLTFYVWKTIWPTKLAALYELPYRLDPFEWRYLMSILAVLAGAILLIVQRRRWPALLTTAVVYLVVIAPVLGVAQSGPQLVADKYSYISCIGWALLAGGGLLLIWLRQPGIAARAASGLLVCAILSVLFAQTWRQTKTWHDSKTLWSHALAVGRPSAIAHLNCGILLQEENELEQAIEHFRQAVEVRPDAGNAWFALGIALKRQKQYHQAEQAYHQAVRFMSHKHRGYLNLGIMYENNLSRLDDAVTAYRSAVKHVEAHRSESFSPTPYLALGTALRKKGHFREARQVLEVASSFRQTREWALQELALLENED